MKKYFAASMLMIVILVLCLLGYGAYLNKKSANEITQLMENRKIPLSGSKAEIRKIYPMIEMETLNFYSDEMTDVTALISGRVIREYVTKNKHVNQGEVLFELENEDIPLKIRQADSDILQSEIELSRARTSYNRYSMLKDMDAISMEKFDESKSIYETAEARLQNYLTQKEQLMLQESHQQVTAPISGEVLMIYRQLGAYVTAGTEMALIGNFDEMKFTTPLNDDVAQKMRVGEKVELIFGRNEDFQKAYGSEYASGNKGKEQKFTAQVLEITPDLSESAEIRKILWMVDNRAGLLEPRLYNNVKFKPTLAHNCLTVPLDAMADATNTKLYKVLEDGTIQIQKVETGVNDGEYIEILSGLHEGDVVIISDTSGLTSGMKAEVTIEGE